MSYLRAPSDSPWFPSMPSQLCAHSRFLECTPAHRRPSAGIPLTAPLHRARIWEPIPNSRAHRPTALLHMELNNSHILNSSSNNKLGMACLLRQDTPLSLIWAALEALLPTPM